MSKFVSHVENLLKPEKEKKRQYSFYVDERMYKAFMKTCKDRGLSGSQVVGALMKDFVLEYGDEDMVS